MNMNSGYQIYQAERGKSYTEQLQADRQAGERAAAVTRRWHAIMRTLRGARFTGSSSAYEGSAAQPGRGVAQCLVQRAGWQAKFPGGGA
ncbi:MAG: hypothetical protein ABSA53_07555 [Streptosporangiaceae bacterium]|jgi:hypothetical protein